METSYDYAEDLDVLHIFTSEIRDGIKGGLGYGNFNIDIGTDGQIVGIELEGASHILKLNPEILTNLDNVMIIERETDGLIFAGVRVAKGEKSSMVQVNIPREDMDQFGVLKATN
ncbi:hypothetical protein CMI42_04230 [Candidatus Pacearchaeota archaeon]|nr:hypothetical protein [Candidatus Pacearchaeota archaeon]|tara:strand:- start:261 stop:605 length:345 start_codon:yes stop_codon:yes gene_type:complete